jgi:hypothetical protein
MYVILDGFDLGIGILFPFAEGEHERNQRRYRESDPISQRAEDIAAYAKVRTRFLGEARPASPLRRSAFAAGT